MFNMQDMVADMLKKSIPPEVFAMLTPEKLKEVGDKATAFVADIRGSLDRIEAKLDVALSQNEAVVSANVTMLEHLKESKNDDVRDGNNASGSGGSRGRRRNNGSGSNTSGDVDTGGSATG